MTATAGWIDQVGDARYVFEAMTIQRMELLVLSTLKWRMQAVTPFSYIDYFLHQLNAADNAPPSRRSVRHAAELILCVSRGRVCMQRNAFSCCQRSIDHSDKSNNIVDRFTHCRNGVSRVQTLGDRRDGRRRHRGRRRPHRRQHPLQHPRR